MASRRGRAGGVQLGLPVTIPKHGASGGQSEVVIQPGSLSTEIPLFVNEWDFQVSSI